jgi:hypothetical protein
MLCASHPPRSSLTLGRKTNAEMKNTKLYWLGKALLAFGLLTIVCAASAAYQMYIPPRLDATERQRGIQMDEYRKSLADSTSVEDLKRDLTALYRRTLMMNELYLRAILGLAVLSAAIIISFTGVQIMLLERIRIQEKEK